MISPMMLRAPPQWLQIVQPSRGADRGGGLDRKIRERLEAIAYASVARFGFEDRKRGIGPR